MSYRSFLDSFLLPSDSSGPDADKRNSEVKNRRQTLKRTFTEPGQPGEMFRCPAGHTPSSGSLSAIQGLTVTGHTTLHQERSLPVACPCR